MWKRSRIQFLRTDQSAWFLKFKLPCYYYIKGFTNHLTPGALALLSRQWLNRGNWWRDRKWDQHCWSVPHFNRLVDESARLKNWPKLSLKLQLQLSCLCFLRPLPKQSRFNRVSWSQGGRCRVVLIRVWGYSSQNLPYLLCAEQPRRDSYNWWHALWKTTSWNSHF